MDTRFADEEHGGYFSTSGEDPSVLLRMKEDYDGAEPSPNSVAALNLLRLSALLDRPEWQARAEKILQAFAAQLKRQPSALPQMLVALDYSLRPPAQIVITGQPDAPETQALLEVVNARFLPHKVLTLANAATAQVLPAMATMKSLESRATAYVCEHYACRQPVTTPEALAALLDPLD
ncbi:MAG: hypothetical protein QM796_10430 [Chthoniobacteraceae bacterium]